MSAQTKKSLFVVKTSKNKDSKTNPTSNSTFNYSTQIKQILNDKYSWSMNTFKVKSINEGQYYFVDILDINYFKDKLPTQNFNINIENHTLKFELHKSLKSDDSTNKDDLTSNMLIDSTIPSASSGSKISTNSTYALVTASVKSDVGSYTPTPIRKPSKTILPTESKMNIWTQFDGISHNQDLQNEIQNGTFFDIMKDTNDEKDIIIKQLQSENTKLKLKNTQCYKLIYSLYNIIKFNNNNSFLSIFPRKEKIYYLNNSVKV
jgi:hypothetical protein